VPTRLAALRWINMLLEKSPQEMGHFIDEILPALLKTLSDPADEVVLLNLQVVRWQLFPSQIAGIALESGSDFKSEKCYGWPDCGSNHR
jgi:hypothetical protein